ncbi:MAG: peroxidase-related enzyme [Bacteroidetes bacterium]|nr:peroxidase-related enzyme [Bacteroidota bacterium]
MAHIKVIQHEQATGLLKKTYDVLVESRGKLAEVHKIQSLNPESIIKHMDLYMSIMYARSPLSRAQREMIAVVVSVTNKCSYCRQHHAEALNHYWRDDIKLKKFINDFTKADLISPDLLLCELAAQLTKYPEKSTESLIESLKELEIDDRAVLDATLVIAYFNFVNRIVLGLGVELEQDDGPGYKY